MRLAESTGNDLFLVILSPLIDLQLEFREREYDYDAREAVEGALNHHRRILDRVKAHQPDRARRAMADHLAQARSMLRKSHSER